MEFIKTPLGAMAWIELDDAATATNRFGNFVKVTRLDVRAGDVTLSGDESRGNIVIEANYSTGTRAAGLALSLDDARKLRDMIDGALSLQVSK